ARSSFPTRRSSDLKHLQLAAAQSPWRLAKDVDDRRAAILVGQGGALDIPLDGPLAPKLHPDKPFVSAPGQPAPEDPPPPATGLALVITMRALAPNQSVTVLWEERPLANLTMSDSWERRTLSLPADVIVTGENRLRLPFRNLAPHRPELGGGREHRGRDPRGDQVGSTEREGRGRLRDRVTGREGRVRGPGRHEPGLLRGPAPPLAAQLRGLRPRQRRGAGQHRRRSSPRP